MTEFAFKAKWIITGCEDDNADVKSVYEDCALLVEDGKIMEVVPQTEVLEEDFDFVEDFKNAVITPGFIDMGANLQYHKILDYSNSKKHSLKWIIASIAQFFKMLGTPINSYPMLISKIEKEYRLLNKKEKTKIFKKGIENSLLAGVTCLCQISETNKNIKNQFEILNNSPLKTVFFFDLKADSVNNGKKVFRKFKKLFKNFQKKQSNIISFGIYPHSIDSVQQKFIRVLAKFARHKNLLFMNELLESKEEKDFTEKAFSTLNYLNNYRGNKAFSYKTGLSTVEYFKILGVLNISPIIKNCNFLSSEEFSALSNFGVKFAVSPKLNKTLFKKSQPIETVLRNFPQKFGFSTGMVFKSEEKEEGNNYEILSQAAEFMNQSAIEDIIKYLTIYPAKILGLDKKTGSLEFNKSADFNVFKLGKKQKSFMDLRYLTNPDEVFINGEKVVSNHEIVIKKA